MDTSETANKDRVQSVHHLSNYGLPKHLKHSNTSGFTFKDDKTKTIFVSLYLKKTRNDYKPSLQAGSDLSKQQNKQVFNTPVQVTEAQQSKQQSITRVLKSTFLQAIITYKRCSYNQRILCYSFNPFILKYFGNPCTFSTKLGRNAAKISVIFFYFYFLGKYRLEVDKRLK